MNMHKKILRQIDRTDRR